MYKLKETIDYSDRHVQIRHNVILISKKSWARDVGLKWLKIAGDPDIKHNSAYRRYFPAVGLIIGLV